MVTSTVPVQPTRLPAPSTVPQNPQISIMSGLMDRQAGNARAASQKILELSAEFMKLDTEHAYLKEEYCRLKEDPVPELPPVPIPLPTRSSTTETCAPLPEEKEISKLTTELESTKQLVNSLETCNQSLQDDMEVLRRTHRTEVEQYRQIMLKHTSGSNEVGDKLVEENCKLTAEVVAYKQKSDQLESELMGLKTTVYGDMKTMKQDQQSLQEKLLEARMETESIPGLKALLREKDEAIAQHMQDALLVSELRQMVRERGEAIANYAQAAEMAEEKLRFTETLMGKLENSLNEERTLRTKLQTDLNDVNTTYKTDLVKWKQETREVDMLRREGKHLADQLSVLSGAAESKLKADMNAMLTMQSTAMEQDTLIVNAKTELNSLRSRYDAVVKEKDLLMVKLVEERSRADPIIIPKRSTSLLSTARMITLETGVQTDPIVDECTLMDPTDEAPRKASIDSVKTRIEMHSEEMKQMQRRVMNKAVHIANLRDVLQSKLKVEMEKLENERNDMGFGSGNGSGNGEYGSPMYNQNSAWSSSRVVSSASRSETPFVKNSNRLEMSAQDIQKYNSAPRAASPPSSFELQRKIAEIQNLHEMIESKTQSLSPGLVSPARSNRCPTISPSTAAPLTAMIGGLGTLHLPGINPL